MENPDQKISTVSVRLQPELREKVIAAAKADRRTLSNWIVLVLESAVGAQKDETVYPAMDTEDD